jgi:hypothetical protein
MRNKVLVFGAVGLCLALGGCFEKKVKVSHEDVKLEALKPDNSQHAAYAYQDPMGFWWYYMLLNSANTTSSSATVYSYPSSAPGGRFNLPAGGTWTRSAKPPAEEDVDEEKSATVTIGQTVAAAHLSLESCRLLENEIGEL